MKKINICFWLNVPSKHQSLFLDELNKNKNINLIVCYFDKVNKDRAKLGWSDGTTLNNYEKKVIELNKTLNELTDWKEYIHIVMGYGFAFNKKLVPLLIKNNAKWIHWSERYGVGLAKRLKFNVQLFKVLRPLFLYSKRNYGNLVQKHAIGCFAQGELAKRDFKLLGISESKIKNLFYTSELSLHLRDTNTDNKLRFLYVGQLSEGKGTLDLLKAYKNLKHFDNSELYLVGEDTSNGDYQAVSKKLGISKHVIFKGIIPFDEIDSIYQMCNVFVFPSRYDGWGAVLNEAASAGMPIIATDQTGAAYHLVEENKNGYRVRSANVKEISNAMQKYIDNPHLIKEHGNYSYVLVSGFTPNANVTRFINAIESWL